MSSSDAAPLPRLGEVFFDVRGDSRSMRLSWYADTGIAVFSIWQGGRCTGTFRLPMEDLARMTEILRRGPQRQRGGSRRDHERGGYDQAGYEQAGHEQAGYEQAGYDQAGYDQAGYDQAGHEQPGRDQAGYEQPGYGQPGYEQPGYDEAGYDEDWYDEEGGLAGGHGAGEHEVTRAYAGRAGANRPSPGQDSAGYGPSAGYADSAGYERPGGYADSAGYERSGGYADFAAGAGPSDATGRYELPARAVRPQDGSYLPDPADHDGGGVTDLSSYGQQRFVPPYVQPGAEAYPNDNPPAGPARRRSAGGPAYPADRAGVSAEPARYPMQADSEAGYSTGSEYRPAADPGGTAQYSAGRHSGRRARSVSPFAEPEPGAADEPISEGDYWSRQAR